MAEAETISDRKIARVVELSGLDEDTVREYLFADWDNQDDHRAWLASVPPQEIADWLAVVGPE